MINVVDSIAYVNIPSKLLFDSTIPPNAKILYGQIKVLSYKNGYCFANNMYFAKNNNLSSRTISTLINKLAKSGYIGIEYNKESINNAKRKIFCIDD